MALIERLGALSGIAGAIGVAVSMSLADAYGTGLGPDPTDRSVLIARALIINKERSRAGAYIGLLAAFFLLWFFAFLYGRVKQPDGQGGWISVVVLGAGLVLVALLLVDVGHVFAASEISNYRGDTEVAKTLHLWGWNSASLSAPTFAALLSAAAILGLTYKAIPRWLSWLTVGMLALLVIVSLLGTAGLGAGIGVVWLMIISLALAVSSAAPSGQA